MSFGDADRGEQRKRSHGEELAERIERSLSQDGSLQLLEDLFIARLSRPTESMLAVYQPALCLVVRGRKQVLLGREVLWYDPWHYLLFTVDLPLVFRVDEASEEQPYMGLRLNIDPALVASVMLEIETPKGHGKKASTVKGINVNKVDGDLLDAVVRLVRLAENPKAAKVLAPLIKREIIYRLVVAGEGERMGHLAASFNGDTRRIYSAIVWLREHYTEQVKMDEIAGELGLSVSGFHHQFKAVTAISPLQYQKQLRLQEARRLMLSEDFDAAGAGHRVGYEDPAYFSRDYKKLFGAPPQRDIARLRTRL